MRNTQVDVTAVAKLRDRLKRQWDSLSGRRIKIDWLAHEQFVRDLFATEATDSIKLALLDEAIGAWTGRGCGSRDFREKYALEGLDPEVLQKDLANNIRALGSAEEPKFRQEIIGNIRAILGQIEIAIDIEETVSQDEEKYRASANKSAV